MVEPRQKQTKNKGMGKSKGKRLRQAAFLKALVGQSLFNITEACATAGIARCQFYEWQKADKKFVVAYEELIERRKAEYEQDLQRESRAGDSRSTIFFLERQARDRGYGKENIYRKVASITYKAQTGVITVLDAAYEINKLGQPLPEFIKLEISKPETPPPPDDRPPLTNDELERKYQESLKAAEEQGGDWLDTGRTRLE